MNIQEAKREIIHTVKAYTAKDEFGCYRVPVRQQRPLLLMGPPGIGKTAVMEQAARECGVGLIAYTITHHTRQSAVGLPQLKTRKFAGKDYTVTEYTMSEIVGSVYEYMERTGCREGILFIDEINCVSETLAPTMLQFLQYKTFGTHQVPEGWVIVAAGNPREYNKSVRDLDMAALDRVRILEVEADFAVWKAYAAENHVHPAILSYLEIKPEYFYQVTLTREKQEFVTARGWEDLSVLLKEYERQHRETGVDFIREFIRSRKIASDFASYYEMYKNFAGLYRIRELLDGTLTEQERGKLSELLRPAKTDVRCIFGSYLLAACSEQMTAYGRIFRYEKRKQEVQEQLRANDDPEQFFAQRAHALQVKKEHGLLKEGEEQLEIRIDRELRHALQEPEKTEKTGIQLTERKQKVQESLNRALDFLLQTFGESTELADWLWGIQNHGDYRLCGFNRPEYEKLCEQNKQEQALRRDLQEMEELYETTDCI